MSINKEKLVKNLVIFAILAVVCMSFLGMTGSTDDFGAIIIAGLTFAIMFYLPVRLFPQICLVGSIIVLLVESFLFVGVMSLLGETVGSVVALLLLLAAFIAGLLFL